MQLRLIHEGEFKAAGELIIEAYLSLPGGHMSDEYAAELSAVEERSKGSEVLVAVDGPCEHGQEAEAVVGCVTLVTDAASHWAELLEADEAGIRMLAVAPSRQGEGIGTKLVAWCVTRSKELGKAAVVLHTTPWMEAAHRLYERAGFERCPERDWRPVPEVPLLAYRLKL